MSETQTDIAGAPANAAPVEEVPTPAEEALEQLQDDQARGPRRARTAADLKARAVHKDVILPSGNIVDVRIPNLPLMIKQGTIPNDLVDASLKNQNVETITREIIIETWDYQKFIIPHMLVEPTITEDDVEELDPLDIELLANLASRRTDIDAVGRQLGGLDTQDSFRQFRAEQSLREALGGV